MKCLNCNKEGHLAKDCSFKESNKTSRICCEDKQDDSGEKAAAGIDYTGNLEDCLLGTVDKNDIINNQDLWIAYSASTVHMTPYKNGLVTIKKVGDRGTIKTGNGTKEPITEIADDFGTTES
jgi:Zinc knuckle